MAFVRQTLLLSALLVASCSTLAAERYFESVERNRQQDPIACQADKPWQCPAIGEIRIGDEFSKLKEILGDPWKSLPREDGSIDAVYPLRIVRRVTDYWVISHKSNRVVAVQLTGSRSPYNTRFQGLSLGDDEDKVIEVLGRPKKRRQYGNRNAWLWDYSPLPFTLEVYNDRLFSVRVYSPKYKLPAQQVVRTPRPTANPVAPLKDVSNNAAQIDTIQEIAEAVVGKPLNDNVFKAIENQPPAQIVDPNVRAARDTVAQANKELGEVKAATGQQAYIPKAGGEPSPATPALSQSQYTPVQQSIISSVDDWLQAWSQKDFLGYFSAYSADYVGPGSASRRVWEEKRIKRIQKPGWIKLDAERFEFVRQTANRATIRFWLGLQNPRAMATKPIKP